MLSSVNFAQPDITLRLDLSGIIQRAALSSTISDERIDDWVGRPWVDTVIEGENAPVRQMLEAARATGVSFFHQVRQRFPSGLELAVEYTTVRLGQEDGLLAIGRNLEVVSELRSRLVAAQKSMERDYWKLREVETRYRLLFDASTQPVLLVKADDTRILEANPAAIRALGVASDRELLQEILPAQRDGFRTMLARVREQGKAPGIVIHLGPDRQPWLLRASLIAAEPTAVFVLQLSPGGTALAAADKRGMGAEPLVARLPNSTPQPADLVGKATLREIVQESVTAVERSCIEAALKLAQGNRTAAAELLGLSRQSLYSKLSRYAIATAASTGTP